MPRNFPLKRPILQEIILFKFYSIWRKGISPPIKATCSLAVSSKGGETKIKKTIAKNIQNGLGIQGNRFGAMQSGNVVVGRAKISYTTEETLVNVTVSVRHRLSKGGKMQLEEYRTLSLSSIHYCNTKSLCNSGLRLKDRCFQRENNIGKPKIKRGDKNKNIKRL